MLHQQTAKQQRESNPLDIKQIYREVAPSVGAMKLPDDDRSKSHHRTNLDEIRPSYGSAFIFDSERGMIVTNWHVARGQKELSLKLGDQTIELKLVGVDESLDLALLKTKDRVRLPAAVRRGDPSKLEVGDMVYAIGSPFGFDNTLSRGIVSGPPRSINLADRPMVKLIQHDATVNPGNSGGVLLNERGEVVGMNTVILSQSGGFQGFALAVPVDLIERSVKELLATGKTTRPSLGLITSSTEHGLAITHVQPGGAADRLGLVSAVSFSNRRGEPDFRDTLFITEINGVPVAEQADLHAALARQRGEPVKLGFRKGPKGRAFELTISPDEVESPNAMALDECMQTRAKIIGPSCEHIRLVSEYKPLTSGDIRGLLERSPFVAVVTSPKQGLGRFFGGRSEEKVTVHVDRFSALAKLVEYGRGIAWLERGLEAAGFKKTEDGKTLRFERSVSNDSAMALFAVLNSLAHGEEPSSGTDAMMLAIPGVLGDAILRAWGGPPPQE
ncbi:MAG: trypsin-like peptidase domain-containing protein [Deltaproteobacteria bacterium]|nr:trypsin-like peptidase domain-containing protein [Deltaproteobacteria bacterium]